MGSLDTLLKIILLVVQLIQSAIEANEKAERDKRLQEIKDDPRAAFKRKFGKRVQPVGGQSADTEVKTEGGVSDADPVRNDGNP